MDLADKLGTTTGDEDVVAEGAFPLDDVMTYEISLAGKSEFYSIVLGK